MLQDEIQKYHDEKAELERRKGAIIASLKDRLMNVKESEKINVISEKPFFYTIHLKDMIGSKWGVYYHSNKLSAKLLIRELENRGAEECFTIINRCITEKMLCPTSKWGTSKYTEKIPLSNEFIEMLKKI
jgi:hypothetical protein